MSTREIRRLSDDAYSTPSWSRDGQWVYLAANPFYTRAGIWKVPAKGGAAIEVTRSPGLLAQESPDGHNLFYFKLDGGIWKMSLPNGSETQVVPGYLRRGCWRVVQAGIYLRSREALEFFDLATGKQRVVANTEPSAPTAT